MIQDSKIRVHHLGIRPEVVLEEMHRDDIVQAGVVHVRANHVPSGAMLARGTVGRPDDGGVGRFDAPGDRVQGAAVRMFERPGFDPGVVDADLVIVAPGVPPVKVLEGWKGEGSVVHAPDPNGLWVDLSRAHGVLEDLIFVETVAERSDGLAVLLKRLLCPWVIAFKPLSSHVEWPK